VPKQIGEAISWVREKSRKERYHFSVTVACPDPMKPLRLNGFIGEVNFSFCLMSQRNQVLRRLNRHIGGHRNPDGSDQGERHKHFWTDEHEDRESYVPEDIDWSDPNQALKDFLEECNITALAAIDSVLLQKALPR
jgi:hypothetical protein